MEPISKTEALIYGGSTTQNVFVIDMGKNGLITPKASLLLPGLVKMHASCGSYQENGDRYVIYAGGLDSG